MLNLESYTDESSVSLCKITLTILDRRSGKIEDRDFYRPANRFPREIIARELDKYGYDVIGYRDEKTVEGIMDFRLMFETLEMEMEE